MSLRSTIPNQSYESQVSKITVFESQKIRTVFIRFGKTINRFVSNLPETKRQSLFQVAEELKSAGMIETTGDITKQHNKNLYNTESR
ncbi:hypothetical protein SRRS_47620 [Sporomusa rhizae]|uniref:hypothetical protein n=1 Tax=Sporomusa rhizae TaxID=357999 RepID=UPI00352A9F0B